MAVTILIVDDEPSIFEFIQMELEDYGDKYEIICEESGYNALGHIMQGKVDFLLTDIAMPDMDGYELFSRAKELDDKLPVVMMTGFGYDPNHAVVKAKKDGLTKVLFKPFEVEDLIALIDEQIKR